MYVGRPGISQYDPYSSPFDMYSCHDTILILPIDAAHTFFISVAGKTALESAGKYSEKCTNQRRKNRKTRVSELFFLQLMHVFISYFYF